MIDRDRATGGLRTKEKDLSGWGDCHVVAVTAFTVGQVVEDGPTFLLESAELPGGAFLALGSAPPPIDVFGMAKERTNGIVIEEPTARPR
ncbi:MAG: hypothetical protein ABI323_11675 [Solirubrobacteraceae bacterium]